MADSTAPITRRDFLNGIPIAVGGAVAAGLSPEYIAAAFADDPAPQDEPGYYPPALTGMRGSHPGSFEAAHACATATSGRRPGMHDTGESYDLVVVGGGISGLVGGAFLPRAASPDARILILDNHDDFGGHAKRNEFRPRAASSTCSTAAPWRSTAPIPIARWPTGLMKTLGIDPAALAQSLRQARDLSGTRAAAAASSSTRKPSARTSWWSARHGAAATVATGSFLADAPLSPQAQRDIVRIKTGTDRLPARPDLGTRRRTRSRAISYRDYLLQHGQGRSAASSPFYQSAPTASGASASTRSRRWIAGASACPGFTGLKLEPGSAPRMGYTPAGYADRRLLHLPFSGRQRLHRAAAGARPDPRQRCRATTPRTSSRAKADYAQLDRPTRRCASGSPAPWSRARNVGDPAAVEGRRGRLRPRRRGLHGAAPSDCVLACWNMMIPYLCPELPAGAESGAALRW